MAFEVTWDAVLRWVWVSGQLFTVVIVSVLAWLLPQLRLGIMLLWALLLAFIVLGRALPGTFANLGLTMLFMVAIFLVGRALFDSRRFGDLYQVARSIVPDYIVGKHILPRLNFQGMRMQYFKGFFLVEYPLDGLTVAWHKGLGVVAHETMSLEAFKRVFVPEEAKPPKPVIGEEQDVDAGEEVETEN